MNRITITIENPDNTYSRTVNQTFIVNTGELDTEGLNCRAVRDLVERLQNEEIDGNNN